MFGPDSTNDQTKHIYVLGDDGALYVSSNRSRPRNSLLQDWKRYEVEWPVPFSDVVEWMPGWDYHDGANLGAIITSDGEMWGYRITKDTEWDSNAVVIKEKMWVRLSLQDIQQLLGDD